MDHQTNFLKQLFDQTNVRPYDDLMFYKNDLLTVCGFAKQKGVRIFGLEGFERKNNGVVPLMDCIADFSYAEPSLEAIEKMLNSSEFNKAELVDVVLNV